MIHHHTVSRLDELFLFLAPTIIKLAFARASRSKSRRYLRRLFGHVVIRMHLIHLCLLFLKFGFFLSLVRLCRVRLYSLQ